MLLLTRWRDVWCWSSSVSHYWSLVNLSSVYEKLAVENRNKTSSGVLETLLSAGEGGGRLTPTLDVCCLSTHSLRPNLPHVLFMSLGSNSPQPIIPHKILWALAELLFKYGLFYSAAPLSFPLNVSFTLRSAFVDLYLLISKSILGITLKVKLRLKPGRKWDLTAVSAVKLGWRVVVFWQLRFEK